MDWENHLEKKSDQKNLKKTVKIIVKLPHVNKKFQSRKRTFVQTPFSHYSKIRVKKIHAAKPLFFTPLLVSA